MFSRGKHSILGLTAISHFFQHSELNFLLYFSSALHKKLKEIKIGLENLERVDLVVASRPAPLLLSSVHNRVLGAHHIAEDLLAEAPAIHTFANIVLAQIFPENMQT